MGGYGSGRWPRPSGKGIVESQRRIDVRRLHREGLLTKGKVAALEWSRDGQSLGQFGVACRGAELVIVYRCRWGDQGEWQDREETVRLEWTACTYGGRRPWLVCPDPDCDRRAAILYLTGVGFRCRECAELTYTSCREDELARWQHKAQMIRRRLGAPRGQSDWGWFPRRPKGMHWHTYEALRDQLIACEMAADDILDRTFTAMLARHEERAARCRPRRRKNSPRRGQDVNA